MSASPTGLPTTEPGPVSRQGSPAAITPVPSDIVNSPEPISADPDIPAPVESTEQDSDSHTKVLLKNIPKNFNNDKILTVFQEHGLTGVKVVGSKRGSTKTLVCLEKNTAHDAIRLIRRGLLGNAKRVRARILNKHDFVQRRILENEEREKAEGPLTPEEMEKRISDKTTPLWKEPYEKQLKVKHQVFSKLMNHLTGLLLKSAPRETQNSHFGWMMDYIQQANDAQEESLQEVLRQRYQAYQEQNIPIPPFMLHKFPKQLAEIAGPNLPMNEEQPEETSMETEDGVTTNKIPEDPTWKEKYQVIHAQYPLPPRVNTPCLVLPTVASPVHTGYRNKCEFTFGVTPNGEPDLGFMLGNFSSGVTRVANADHCLHVHPRAVQLVQKMRDYVSNVSPHPVYNQIERVGVWRLFVTRTQASGEDMVIVQYNPTNLSDEEQQTIQEDLKRLFSTSEADFVPVTSLYIQETPDQTNGISQKSPIVLLAGAPLIHEKLLDTQFQISPHSFFQVNTLGAERLYSIVRDWAMGKPSPLVTSTTEGTTDSVLSNGSEDILLDLCCGTGTIGILMAKYFRQVIGIELIPQAVEDANTNATAKGITNAKFIAGPVEKLLGSQLQQLKTDGVIMDTSSVVAVLDPPRNGVNNKVLAAIRECPAIRRVVFVACDFKQSMKNIVDLCRPPSNRYPGTAFCCTQAVPVDLFPHTNACELVIELVRVSPKAETPDVVMLQ
ncbi:hypothetical protein IWQ61_005960 [Dispira simplex]|nr:hypothetical protein IWQ61_005960 [Dispira simplex]